MDKKLFFLFFLFFVVFSVFSFTALRQGPLTGFIRAKEETMPSAEKSLIIAWPINANSQSNGESKITVFIRNNKEVPIANKTVRVTTTLGNISPSETATDKTGKAEFVLKSNTPGLAEIGAIVDNSIELKHKISVKFE